MDPGTEAGHVRGDLPDAHRSKNDPDTGWLYEVCSVALEQGLRHLPKAYASSGPNAPSTPRRFQAPVPGIGEVHRLGVLAPGRPDLAGQDERAAGDRVVKAAARRRGTVHRHCEPGRGRPLAHLDPGRMPGRTLPPASRRWGSTRGSRPWSRCRRGRRSPTRGTSGGTGAGSRSPSGARQRSRKGPRTGPGPGSRWRGCTPGSPTGAATTCTSCPPGSSARTKR